MQVYGQKQVINGPSRTGGMGGLEVNGSAIKENIPIVAAVKAPTAQFNFKVVSYDQNEKQTNPTRNQFDFNNQPTSSTGP